MIKETNTVHIIHNESGFIRVQRFRDEENYEDKCHVTVNVEGIETTLYLDWQQIKSLTDFLTFITSQGMA